MNPLEHFTQTFLSIQNQIFFYRKSLKKFKQAFSKKKTIFDARKTEPWFTSKVKCLAAEKRKAYLKYHRNKIDEENQEYVTVKNKVKSKIVQIKRGH